jgi:predicted dinucleotide-binding enzyme
MKVGILGSGDVAKSLARGFAGHGDAVTIGTRSPGKLAGFTKENPGVKVGTFAEAAASGETLVLAVKGAVAADALRLAGPSAIRGKVVIDACNPIAEGPPDHGVLRFFPTPEGSLMEGLQKEFPEARFVKAFNSVGHDLMVNPRLPGGPPTMFLCGNDPEARATVKGILDRFGWETADMGGAEAARAIEPLCILWCIPGFLRNEWGHAFKLLK